MALFSLAATAGVRAGPARFSTGGLLLVLVMASLLVTPCAHGALIYLEYNNDQLGSADVYSCYRWSSFLAWSPKDPVTSAIMNYARIINTLGSFNQMAVHLLDFEKSNTYQFNFGIVQVVDFQMTDDKFKATAGGGGTQLSAPRDVPTFSSPISPPSDTPHVPSDEILPPTPPVPEPATLSLLAVMAISVWGRRRPTSDLPDRRQ